MSDVTNLNEEIFCLRYELNTLANVLLRNESERWVPGYLYEQTEHSHIARYKLAAQYTAGKSVIDIACGIGKGSNMIATEGKAAYVNGFDIDLDAIRYANFRFKNDNIAFAVKNAESLWIVDEFDFAVSFETVEHLPNYKDFLFNINKCLKPGGLFIISTPISSMPIDGKPANPYHVQEWGFYEFQHTLKEFFDIQKVYVQLYPCNPPLFTKPNVLVRGYHKIKRLFGIKSPSATDEGKRQPESKFSNIEEFSGQYNADEFGISRLGYQIVLAKRKFL